MAGTKATSNEVRPVYAVFGSEAFLRREHAADIIQRVLGDADRTLSLTEHDGPSAELATVLDDLRTLPFLTERRLVIVREADAFLAREDHRDALTKYLDSASPTGVLLLIGKTLDARWRVSKAIAAVGEIYKCEKDRRFNVPAWAAERAATRGKQLEPAAAMALVDLVGADLACLDNEIDKLSLYVGDAGVVTRDHVAELVGLQREEKVFAITDAIADGDAARALQLWDQTWTLDRSAPARAVGGLAWGLRRLIEAKEMVLDGTPIEAIARRLWTDPQRLGQRLDRWSLDRLRRQLDALLEADLSVKTGLSTAPRAVEKFIVSQCQRQRERKVAHVT